MPDFIVGIDGGGTSCRAAVAARDGVILGRGKSGAANILTDPDTALANILAATQAAFHEAGIDERLVSSSAALVGVAGHNVGEAVHYVRARLPFACADIESDGLIALQGALGDRDGAVGILGTGTLYIIRHAGTVRYLGGWGFAVGDLGSGARLGQAALQECLLAYDGIHAKTELTRSLLDEFGNDPGRIVEFGRAAHPGDFGRYAPAVFDHAGRRDATALSIIGTAAATIDEALDAVASFGGPDGGLCLLGGLARFYIPYIAERHRLRVGEPLADALTGAVALAAARFSAVAEITS